MSDDDAWVEQQQRAHNYRSYSIELPPLRPKRPKRHTFTITELLAGERWAEQHAQKAATT